MQKTEISNYRLTYDKRIVTQEDIEVFKYTLKAFQLIQLPSNAKELTSINSDSNSLVDFDLIKAYVKELSKLNIGDKSIIKITKQCLIPRTGEELSQRELRCENLYNCIGALYRKFCSPTTTDSTSHSGYLKHREEAIEQEIER